MKKVTAMTQDEKIEYLLKWAVKTHKKIDEMIDVINSITTHLNDFNGQSFLFIKEPKKRET